MWQPIETAPKHGSCMLLFWPKYSYETDGIYARPLIAIGSWKYNHRIERGYFSDTGEWDDYGLAEPQHSPTHWMPLPEPPE